MAILISPPSKRTTFLGYLLDLVTVHPVSVCVGGGVEAEITPLHHAPPWVAHLYQQPTDPPCLIHGRGTTRRKTPRPSSASRLGVPPGTKRSLPACVTVTVPAAGSAKFYSNFYQVLASNKVHYFLNKLLPLFLFSCTTPPFLTVFFVEGFI